jgi:hypothetical protein
MKVLLFASFGFVLAGALNVEQAVFEIADPKFELGLDTFGMKAGKIFSDQYALIRKVGSIAHEGQLLMHLKPQIEEMIGEPQAAAARSTSALTGQLIDQYIGMFEAFPWQDIVDVMAPVLREKDRESFEQLRGELSTVEKIVKDPAMRNMIGTNIDEFKELVFTTDLEHLSENLSKQIEAMKYEPDVESRTVMMRSAGENMGSFVSRAATSLMKIGKRTVDAVDGTAKRAGLH